MKTVIQITEGEQRDWEDMLAESIKEEVSGMDYTRLGTLSNAVATVMNFFQNMAEQQSMDTADCVAELTMLHEAVEAEMDSRPLYPPQPAAEWVDE